MDAVGLVLGLAFTLAIFSYLIGDNAIYRIAIHILIGATAAYAGVVALRTILIPAIVRLAENPTETANALWLIPLLLGLFLLIRTLPRVAWVGQSSIAALMGIGAAVALTGAVTGTLLPQLLAVGRNNALFGLVSALLTVCTLIYFQYTFGSSATKTNSMGEMGQRIVGNTGRLVLTITFGALFAGALSTALLLLTSHLNSYMRALGF